MEGQSTWAAEKQLAHRMRPACREFEIMVEIDISQTFYYSAKHFNGFEDEIFFRGNLKQT
jgi:hypothetical protein